MAIRPKRLLLFLLKPHTALLTGRGEGGSGAVCGPKAGPVVQAKISVRETGAGLMIAAPSPEAFSIATTETTYTLTPLTGRGEAQAKAVRGARTLQDGHRELWQIQWLLPPLLRRLPLLPLTPLTPLTPLMPPLIGKGEGGGGGGGGGREGGGGEGGGGKGGGELGSTTCTSAFSCQHRAPIDTFCTLRGSIGGRMGNAVAKAVQGHNRHSKPL